MSRTPLALAALTVGLVFASTPLRAQTAEDVREAGTNLATATEAWAANDDTRFLEHVSEALALRPGHPQIHYLMARGYARIGDEEKIAEHFEAIGEMGIGFNPTNDETFADYLEVPRIQQAVQRMIQNREPKGEALRFAEVPIEVDFIPEGLAFDPRTGTSYLGSVRLRRIVQFAPGDTVADFAPKAFGGLAAAMGMEVDEARRLLWVASSGVEQVEGLHDGERGRAALFQFDVESGALNVHFHFPPTDDREHTFGDLVLDEHGRVYVSDAAGTGIYTVRPGGDFLETFINPGEFVSPQGIAIPNEGPWMYVADYSRGIVRIHQQSKEMELMERPEGSTLLGIDELAWHDGDLIAVQNGTTPKRILRLPVDGAQIREVEILAQALPEWSEPTLGYVHDGWFVFVANSQWDRFRGPDLQTEGLKAPLVQRIRLR